MNFSKVLESMCVAQSCSTWASSRISPLGARGLLTVRPSLRNQRKMDKDAEADDRIRLNGLGDLGGVLAVGVDGLRGACVTGEAKPE